METVTARINLSALDYNMKKICAIAGESKVIAVVKANAYGHGSVACAKVMQPYVHGFAVARLEEALELRQAGIDKMIIMLGGFSRAVDLKTIEEQSLDFTVHNFEQLEALSRYQGQGCLKAWCQVNVGMQRLGFNEEECAQAIKMLEDLPCIAKPCGLISHLSCADDPKTYNYNEEQIAAFVRMSKLSRGVLCLANSAGILDFPVSRTTYVRSGIIQYGITPYGDGRQGADLGLRPVMNLVTRIIEIRNLKPGDVVGYGASWTCTKPTKLAVLAAGYADGYPRSVPNGTPVLLNGRLVKTVGHVCMDMMFVDIGADAQDKLGDEALLWGEGNPVEGIARSVGTIAYELVTRPTRRVRYEYVTDEELKG